MIKKIILLFLISFSWQLNLFSMNAKSSIESIDESINNCVKCGSTLYQPGTSFWARECSNDGCKQAYWVKRNNSNWFSNSTDVSNTDSIKDSEIEKEKDTTNANSKKDLSITDLSQSGKVTSALLESLSANTDQNDRYSKVNNTINLTVKKMNKENLIKAFILRKLKYLVPAAVICLAVWKYHSQIKKFLFRK